MRLSDEYRSVIKETLLKHFGQGCKFYLFGSRTDDNKRGGDIDLYVETDFEDFDRAWQAKNKSYRELMDRLDEQKIDIVLHVKGKEFQPIENIARLTGIEF